MHLNMYQKKAKSTAVYSKHKLKIMYPALGLCGEAGEVANVVKKIFRDDAGKLTKEKRQKLKDEISDVIWYIAALATDLDLNLDDIAVHNLEKLRKRKKQGTLQGSGDNR